MFYWHVEAVDLDGNRELWSPTFVGFLWEYWQRSHFGDHVCMPEKDLLAQAEAEGFKGLPCGVSKELFARKPVEWPKPVYKPPRFAVPSEFHKHMERPDLPPLPARFPHRLIYKENCPLETGLARNLDGTEAWDAMLGASNRLQAAARNVLHSEKLGAAAERALASRHEAKDVTRRKSEHGYPSPMEVTQEAIPKQKWRLREMPRESNVIQMPSLCHRG